MSSLDSDEIGLYFSVYLKSNVEPPYFRDTAVQYDRVASMEGCCSIYQRKGLRCHSQVKSSTIISNRTNSMVQLLIPIPLLSKELLTKYTSMFIVLLSGSEQSQTRIPSSVICPRTVTSAGDLTQKTKSKTECVITW